MSISFVHEGLDSRTQRRVVYNALESIIKSFLQDHEERVSSVIFKANRK